MTHLSSVCVTTGDQSSLESIPTTTKTVHNCLVTTTRHITFYHCYQIVCQPTIRYAKDLQDLLRLVSAVIIIWFKSVVNYGILAHCHTVVGRNVMFLTRHYVWSLDQLVSGQLLLHNADFMAR